MTTAQHNAQIDARIDALRTERAFYDDAARNGLSKALVENAIEQAARITGYMAQLRAMRHNY